MLKVYHINPRSIKRAVVPFDYWSWHQSGFGCDHIQAIICISMDSIQNKVYYCCVSKGSRILYAYSGGDHEIENVAALCMERAPSFHWWYFETIGKRTYGFLMEDGYVYFTIVDESLGNSGVLRFLEHVRDEFRNLAKKDSRGSLSNMNSVYIQEKLVPVIRRLITSLESVSDNNSNLRDETLPFQVGLSPSPSNLNGQIEGASSTKAPLLGKSNKQDKKKAKDHVIAMRDVELEENRKSTDRGIKVDSGNVDSNSQGGAAASFSLQKDFGSMRMRSGPQSIRKKWWRQVRIVLAIDAAVCLILFVIWLIVCGGISCIR
ncbi:phytolongin Phyl1.1-like [Prosopis cineraria]|uniref:phytolongin Phyl1.1-like n=1 Tax=Prosopis cineraria TaxID=364024 RepID=UPI00240F9028|nr:phytolongin Phyl1.1-like [Prosopis cineraria]XP_054815950.1 phytolongin Phyl1.1-like [Prosopis cineraria]XP_054815951.1 phytolongin Phyl1.1-like [Prosopis cineraria]XP_054815952.1 phytolongin Phyl1.1-like [Prosopis cineraria]